MNYFKLMVKAVLLSLISLNSAAQTINFELLAPDSQFSADFMKVINADLMFADMDGDSNLDLVASGEGYNQPPGVIYFNNEPRKFKLKDGVFFWGLEKPSFDIADVDGDQDLDLIVCGRSMGQGPQTILYLNDGNGVLSRKNSFFHIGVIDGDVLFGDIDGDDDVDLLISGYTEEDKIVSELYKNDGGGSFSLFSDTTIAGIYRGSSAFADVDSDNDLDLIISGISDSILVTTLYKNDGLGNFASYSGLEDTLAFSTVKFADVDQDNDLDLMITGRNNKNLDVANLYINDGSGNFSLKLGTNFKGVSYGDIEFLDVDLDGDLDFFIGGGNNMDQTQHTILYLNDGAGNFSKKNTSTIPTVSFSGLASADVNRDGFPDIVISGLSGSDPITELFLNNGDYTFSQVLTSDFEGFYGNGDKVSVADIDRDSDLDLVLNGRNKYGDWTTNIYRNNGNGNFQIDSLNTLDSLAQASLSFIDLDTDEDMDLIVSGHSLDSVAKIYINNGSGLFTQDSNSLIPSVQNGSISVGDIDNDFDDDLFISGEFFGVNISKIFQNQEGTFIEMPQNIIEGVSFSSSEFGDIDGDNDLDLIISGLTNLNQPTTKVYLNNGSGDFTQMQEHGLQSLSHSDIAMADLDNDLDLDLVVVGERFGTGLSFIYLNDGKGNFEWLIPNPIQLVRFGSVSISDVDLDGDNDIFISGLNDNNYPISSLYQNNGECGFSIIDFPAYANHVYGGTSVFADFDGDEDPDLFYTGINFQNRRLSLAYNNLGLNCEPKFGIDSHYVSCGTFTWLDCKIYTKNNDSATFVIAGGASNGCDSIVTLNLIVDSVNVNVEKSGSTLIAEADSVDSKFRWIDCSNGFQIIPGETSSKFTAKEVGWYAVEVEKNGCVDTSKCILIREITSLNSQSNTFSIYPNPTENAVLIRTELTYPELTIEINNVVGQLVSTHTYKNQNLIRLQLLGSPGVYYLSMYSEGNHLKTMKLIKK